MQCQTTTLATRTISVGAIALFLCWGATAMGQRKARTQGSYQRLVKQYLGGNPKRVVSAKKALKAAGRRALPALVSAFRDPSLGRRTRLLALLRPFSARKGKALARMIRYGKGAQRSGAIYALTHLVEHPPAHLQRLLLWRLRRGPWYVRGAAAYALSRARPTPRIQAALLKALKDRAWRVKGNAAAGLRRAGKRAHKQLKQLKTHADWSVRATANALLSPPTPHTVTSRTKPTPRSRQLRVMTYNICHGAGMDGSYSLARIARVIRRSKADIIGLQEVDQGTRRSLGHHQLKRLAKMLKMHSRFGKAIAFQGGHFGNGLLSRFPIQAHRIHTLSQLGGWEPRSIIEAHIVIPKSKGRKVRIFSTHLDNRSTRARMAAVLRLQQLLAQNKTPALLLGDINASPKSPTLLALGKHWHNPLTARPLASMPATVPLFQIDYVLHYPRRAWQFVDATIDRSPLAQIASDHRPLVMTLTWPAPNPTRRP